MTISVELSEMAMERERERDDNIYRHTQMLPTVVEYECQHWQERNHPGLGREIYQQHGSPMGHAHYFLIWDLFPFEAWVYSEIHQSVRDQPLHTIFYPTWL